MLNSERDYILFLLRKSLGKQTESVEEPSNVRMIANIIHRNGIMLTVYSALSVTLQSLFVRSYHAAIKQSILQKHEGEQALKTLSDASIDCIALKGWEMQSFYPQNSMRQMADLDMLVRPYDFKRIKAVMEGLGYKVESESSWKHDSFRKGEVRIEMHKRLADDSDNIQKWESSIWSRAILVQGHIYRMALEDFYIFHFVHLHKDFMNGSLGLRRIVDTWLLQKQTVDMDVVKMQLQQIGLWAFHEKIVRLSFAVMGEELFDKDSEYLLSHAFQYGIYGSDISYKAGRIATMGNSIRDGKYKSVIAAIFLPYKRMKAQFPILIKWPILLPCCWIKRIMYFLWGSKKKYRHKLDYRKVTEEDYQEMMRFYEAGGVR